MAEFITSTGVVYYEDVAPTTPAANPPESVLLLHNFMSTGRTAWGAIADTLVAQRYRVIVPDLPGHGRSRGYPPHFNYADIAGQIAALVAALGLERPHLAGCSAGGAIAMRLVEDELVDATTLTLVSSSYSTNPTTTGLAIDTRPEAYRAGAGWLEATAKLHDPSQGEGYFANTLLPAYRALTPATALDLPLHALPAWTIPVCLIHGAEDEIFPVAIAEQMYVALPDSELHIIPRQGHALIFRQSRKVGEILQDFLARHALTTAH